MERLSEGMDPMEMSPAAGDNAINTPDADDSGVMDSPGLEGSFQQLMSENLGRYVQIDFLVGVQTIVRRSGILYAVGRSFVVLYDETNRNFVMCDVFSAKFVAFFAERPRPGTLPNNPMGIMQGDAQGNLWPVEDMSPAPRPITIPGTPPSEGLVLPQPQPIPRSGPGWVVLGAQQQR